MSCVFCEIIANKSPARKVWENDEFVAFYPIKHVNPGHTLLIPKQHIDYVFDLSKDSYRKLWESAQMLAEPIRRATSAKRMGIAVEGFSVPHVHIHLVPINGVAELDPHREKKISASEADNLQRAIVENLKTIPTT